LTYPNAYNIVSFDKLDYCSSLNNTRVLNDKRNFTFYHGDITNPSEVMDCLERHNIDTIFHFAAQSHVDLSFGNSYAFTHTNVYGTHVLLESAKKVGIKKFIHISTDEVYGEVRDDADDLLESSILAPTNPYAASKAAAEMLVHSYQKSFKLPVIIVRSNNVYGPHQYPESKISSPPFKPHVLTPLEIIPKFSLLLHRGQPVVLHGDGTPTRRYLFAGDAADAFDTILHKGQMDQIYNVGSYDEISNLTLCSKLLTYLNIPHGTQVELHKWVKHTIDRPFNDHRYAVDGTKLRQLGWEQKTSFSDGMAITVDWYKRFGESWWGDITKVLTPFPTVAGTDVIASDEPVEDIQESMIVDTDDQMTLAKKRKINGISVGAQAVKA
jgi:dTDP-glucose 4,6-dehydratase